MMSASAQKFSTKVSIVLPTYNQAQYLASAINTILKQTFQDFELIIVNDGSTDETTQLLSTLNHPKIKILSQHNQGLPSALNLGFLNAHGEYWTWTSTDNVVAPTWLEELVNALDQSPSDIGYAFSYYAAIDQQDKLLFVNRDQRFDIPTLLLRHTGNASFLYRSNLARKVGTYNASLVYAEDLDMWIRMAEHTRAVHVEKILYYYRLHDRSMTTQQEKVKAASREVIRRFLARTGGKIAIDTLFPHIAISADPAFERWKARVWLVTLGMNATFYCPVDALIDQLHLALQEHYDRSLVANIVHLLAKEQRWDEALHEVSRYLQKDPSDFLKQLAEIVSQKSIAELQKIPLSTLNESYLATDCKSSLSQKEILRNLSPLSIQQPVTQAMTLEKIACDLVTKLSDKNDHPEVWESIAQLNSLEDKKALLQLIHYLNELTRIPQENDALILLKILMYVCLACAGEPASAKQALELLQPQHPNLLVLAGALRFVERYTPANAYAT